VPTPRPCRAGRTPAAVGEHPDAILGQQTPEAQPKRLEVLESRIRDDPTDGSENPYADCSSSGFEIDYRYGAAGSTHRLAVLILYLYLPYLAPAAGVHRGPGSGQNAPGTLGPEVAGVYLRTECSFARGTMQEGADASDRLGQNDADPPMQVAEGLQVPAVYPHRRYHTLRP
jgi:hypothetical protein